MRTILEFVTLGLIGGGLATLATYGLFSLRQKPTEEQKEEEHEYPDW